MIMLLLHQQIEDKDFYYIYNYNEAMHQYMRYINKNNLNIVLENVRNAILDLLQTKNQYLVIVFNDGKRLILDQTNALKFFIDDIKYRLSRK